MSRTELIPVADGERRKIGPFDCQFIPVTHSVPHGFATAIFTPAGHDPALRRLQARPEPGRRPHDRPGPHRRDRPARGPAPPVRLHQRRGGRPHAVGVDGRGRAPGVVLGAQRQADHRRLLRLPHPPGATDRRGGHRERPARSPSSAGPCSRTSGWPGAWDCSNLPDDSIIDIDEIGRLRAGPGLRHLHRFPGRADERAGADGRPREPPGEARHRRHRHHLGPPDPRQRGQRLPGHRRAPPGRRRRRALRSGRRPRLGPRQPGGAQVLPQPGQAGVLRARPRRVPPPGAPRPPGQGHGHARGERRRSARTATG